MSTPMSDRPTISIGNETRPMTDKELENYNITIVGLQEQAAVAAAEAAAKQSAIDKLAALGLSVDEIRAAFGLEGN